MITTRFFPTLIMILNILSAAGYALHGWHEWRKIIYWLSAAVLTFTVTY